MFKASYSPSNKMIKKSSKSPSKDLQVSVSVEEGALYTKQSDFSCLFLRRLTRLTSSPGGPWSLRMLDFKKPSPVAWQPTFRSLALSLTYLRPLSVLRTWKSAENLVSVLTKLILQKGAYLYCIWVLKRCLRVISCLQQQHVACFCWITVKPTFLLWSVAPSKANRNWSES